jgi:EmrB/QacA subfamily drug resistance transporter
VLNYKWTVLSVTTIGVLMAGIDTRIVIIGLPEVIAVLKADVEQGIWINQAYLLGSVAVLLLIGRISDMFGRKRVYVGGFFIFTVGSALTSLAGSPLQIILFRIVQGVGAGILITNSVALITDATPTNELGFSLGVNNLGFRFGAMAGLTISGVILSFIGDWRALFYVNIPIGIFGTIWAQVALKESMFTEKEASIDWTGFFTFTVSITSFLLALTYGAYGIAIVNTVYELFVLSMIMLTVFVIHERRCRHPLLDFKLLHIREFLGGVLAQLLNAIAWGAVLLLLSLYLQLVIGLGPFDAGIRMIPFDIAFLICGPLSGKLSDKLGHLPFTTSGIVLTSISLYLFSTMDSLTPYSILVCYMVLFGAGIGIFGSPNMSSIMGSVPPKRRGIGSALRATFFNVGFATSLNLAILIMSLVVPYALVTLIISSGTTVITQSDQMMFMSGLKTAFLWLAVLNAIAVIPSILRGKGLKGHEKHLQTGLASDGRANTAENKPVTSRDPSDPR